MDYKDLGGNMYFLKKPLIQNSGNNKFNQIRRQPSNRPNTRFSHNSIGRQPMLSSIFCHV